MTLEVFLKYMEINGVTDKSNEENIPVVVRKTTPRRALFRSPVSTSPSRNGKSHFYF